MSHHLAERIAYHNATLPKVEMFYGLDECPMEARAWASALRVIASAGYVIVDREKALKRVEQTLIKLGLGKGPVFDPDWPLVNAVARSIMGELTQGADDAT